MVSVFVSAFVSIFVFVFVLVFVSVFLSTFVSVFVSVLVMIVQLVQMFEDSSISVQFVSEVTLHNISRDKGTSLQSFSSALNILKLIPKRSPITRLFMS